VLKTHGDVINELPASNPFLRNLRLSTAITPLPFVLGVPTRSRRSTLCRTEKFPDQIVPRERDCVGGDLTIHKTKKARQTLAGLSGYLASTEPATSMVQQTSREISSATDKN
jgi:hypothetical protein